MLAVEPQAILAHGLEVGAARHERHVVAGGGQPRPEVAAHAAWPHHRDLHGLQSPREPQGVMTTRPTMRPARRSSSERLVSDNGRISTGIGAILPALTRSSISRASAGEPT